MKQKHFHEKPFLFLMIGLGMMVSSGLLAETEKNCGRLAISLGQVKNGAGNRLLQGGNLSRGEKIITGTESFAKVLLTDDSIVDIGPESRFVLEKCVASTKSSRDVDLTLELGKIRVNVNKKAEGSDNNFKVRTPTSVLAVRGTEFYLIWEKTEAGEIFENIALTEGMVEASTRFETNKPPIKLTAGNEIKATGLSRGEPGQNQKIESGNVRVDQLTASEQKMLEEQIRISPNLDSSQQELPKKVWDTLLDPKDWPELYSKPLVLFQGNFAQAQQGNYSVILSAGGTVSTSSGTGNSGSGGSNSAGGGGTPPVYSGGTIRFYDQ